MRLRWKYDIKALYTWLSIRDKLLARLNQSSKLLSLRFPLQITLSTVSHHPHGEAFKANLFCQGRSHMESFEDYEEANDFSCKKEPEADAYFKSIKLIETFLSPLSARFSSLVCGRQGLINPHGQLSEAERRVASYRPLLANFLIGCVSWKCENKIS